MTNVKYPFRKGQFIYTAENVPPTVYKSINLAKKANRGNLNPGVKA